MKKPERNRTRNLVLPLMVMVGVVGVWETLVWSFHMPTYILPAPSQIFLGLISDLGLLWVHAQVTTIEILVGFEIGRAHV
jgi:ABC-type nitrate/sulfonate/bicarbonate transport system permease component